MTCDEITNRKLNFERAFVWKNASKIYVSYHHIKVNGGSVENCKGNSPFIYAPTCSHM